MQKMMDEREISKACFLMKIKKILRKYNLKAKKYLGQYFLLDKDVLATIIESARMKPSDIILEIGPGLGVLTQELAKKAKKVIAIEKDKNLAKILKERYKKGNVEIIQGDILKLSLSKISLGRDYTSCEFSKENYTSCEFSKENYKVVANLPYYIASATIRKFLEEKNPPRLMVLMVQKEVGQKICSRPPRMNILAVACQLYSLPEIVRIVKKESFWPRPKVDGAILKIEPLKKRRDFLDPVKFFKVVKTGFSHPRKQLKNNLKLLFGKKTEKILEALGINPGVRAQELRIEDWKRLAGEMANNDD